MVNLIFAGFFLGILLGWLIGEPILPVAEPMKDLFLRLLRMAILPLALIGLFLESYIVKGLTAGSGK